MSVLSRNTFAKNSRPIFDATNNQVVRRIRYPPILTNRECLDSVITCRVCWNGFSSQRVVYINDPVTGVATLEKCPNCNGTGEMKSTTKEESEQLKKEIKDRNVEKPPQ